MNSNTEFNSTNVSEQPATNGGVGFLTSYRISVCIFAVFKAVNYVVQCTIYPWWEVSLPLV